MMAPLLGRRIRYLRRLNNWDQAELAQKVGITQPTLSRIERDQRELTVHEAFVFAEALGIEPFVLLNPSHDWIHVEFR